MDQEHFILDVAGNLSLRSVGAVSTLIAARAMLGKFHEAFRDAEVRVFDLQGYTVWRGDAWDFDARDRLDELIEKCSK